jgi:GGDEF domain-containing protein
MNEIKTAVNDTKSPIGADLLDRVQFNIQKATELNKTFFIVLLQLENLADLRKRKPPQVINGLLRELFQAVRSAVHPSQFVGYYRNGLAVVFDRVDAGQIDSISSRLLNLSQHVVKSGKYNDLTSRWTDIIYEFLCPQKTTMLITRVGWSIFPRDGASPMDLLKRAQNHAAELSR